MISPKYLYYLSTLYTKLTHIEKGEQLIRYLKYIH